MQVGVDAKLGQAAHKRLQAGNQQPDGVGSEVPLFHQIGGEPAVKIHRDAFQGNDVPGMLLKSFDGGTDEGLLPGSIGRLFAPVGFDEAVVELIKILTLFQQRRLIKQLVLLFHVVKRWLHLAALAIHDDFINFPPLAFDKVIQGRVSPVGTLHALAFLIPVSGLYFLSRIKEFGFALVGVLHIDGRRGAIAFLYQVVSDFELGRSHRVRV